MKSFWCFWLFTIALALVTASTADAGTRRVKVTVRHSYEAPVQVVAPHYVHEYAITEPRTFRVQVGPLFRRQVPVRERTTSRYSVRRSGGVFFRWGW